jgi:hypothetical protein
MLGKQPVRMKSGCNWLRTVSSGRLWYLKALSVTGGDEPAGYRLTTQTSRPDPCPVHTGSLTEQGLAPVCTHRMHVQSLVCRCFSTHEKHTTYTHIIIKHTFYNVTAHPHNTRNYSSPLDTSIDKEIQKEPIYKKTTNIHPRKSFICYIP